MPYDLGKIGALEAHHQIVDHISRQLAACSAFNNNSLSYFGLEIRYKIEIILHSRGKTQESLQAAFPIGEMPDNPEVQRAIEQAETGIHSEHVTVTDEQLAGSAARKLGRVASEPTVIQGGASQADRGVTSGEDVGVVQLGSGDAATQRPTGPPDKPPASVPTAHRKGRGRG